MGVCVCVMRYREGDCVPAQVSERGREREREKKIERRRKSADKSKKKERELISETYSKGS